MATEGKKKISVTTWIVLSMVAGVAAGVIGGEVMANIQFVGDIFFRLVQMGIIPFVMCTIITSVGGLSPQALSGFGLKGIVYRCRNWPGLGACAAAWRRFGEHRSRAKRRL